MSTTIDNGPTHLNLRVSVEPLFSQHGYERGEESGGQTRVKDGLDVDDSGIGATPLRESGVSLRSPKLSIGDNLEDIVAQFCEIRLELRLNGDDES